MSTLYHDQNKQRNLANGSVFDGAKDALQCEVGRVVSFSDGRKFVYAKAGGTIAKDNAVVANINSQAVAATYFGKDASTAPAVGEGGAIGDTKVRLSDDVTGVTENEYVGGYLLITEGTGAGEYYRVRGNEATSTDGEGFLVEIYDGLRVALDNTSVGVLISHPLNGVVCHTAADYGGTATQVCVGAALSAATSGQYLWIQTAGPGIAKAGSGTGIVGAPGQLAEDDDGSLQVPVATENRIQIVGVWLANVSDGKYGPFFWNTGF